MKLHIDDSKTIEEIQKEFTKVFSFLKVEFFTKSHEVGEASAKKDLIANTQKLGDIRTKHAEGDLLITAEMEVGEVENAFEENFGVHVQIFRKQNNVWLETTNSDSWTLAKQNETAEFMSTPVDE
jgi:uncharacterized protein (DUF1697 family)